MDAGWQPVQGCNPTAGVDPAAAEADWRAELQLEGRIRIVNRIVESLKRLLPVLQPEGLRELQRMVVVFELKMYNEATSKTDYLRKISLKILSMETRTQQAPGNAQVIPNQNNPGQACPKKACSSEQVRGWLLSVVAIVILVVIVWLQ